MLQIKANRPKTEETHRTVVREIRTVESKITKRDNKVNKPVKKQPISKELS